MIQSLKTKIVGIIQKPSFKYILVLTFFMFVSRGLGFVRNILLGSLDPILEADLILAATKIPELLVSLLIMGTISSSVLPVAARIDSKKTQVTVSEYINLIYISIILILLLVTIFLLIFTPQALQITTSGELMNQFHQAGLYDRYIWMTRILMLGPLAFATQGVFGIYLTLKERFTIYSWSGAIYNIGMIGGIAIFMITPQFVYAPAIGMMVGAIASSVLYIVECTKHGYKLVNLDFISKIRRDWPRLKPDFYATWRVFFPRVFLLNGIVIGNLLINRIADGWQGQVTAVDIALSIQGVFFSLITSASTVFFPNIAKTYHAAHGRVFWKRIFKFLEGVSVLSVIGTVATVIGVPIVLWIFTLFQKDFNNVEYIILLTRIAAVGIVLQSGVEILSKYIYIKERVWQPAIMSMSGVIVQVFCTFWLRYVLEVDAGISVIIGIIVNYAVLFLYMFLVSVGDRNRDLFEN